MILELLYVFATWILAIPRLFYRPDCDTCKGSDGHCNECKHSRHPERRDDTKNLYKPDRDRIYQKWMR